MAQKDKTREELIVENRAQKEQVLGLEKLICDYQVNKEKFSTLISCFPDEIWLTDVNKRFILANPSALHEFNLVTVDGIMVEDLAQKLEVYRSDMSPRPIEEAPPLRALSGEVVVGQEEIVRVPISGELRYRQVSAAPIRNESGVIVGGIAIVRDITDRKMSEMREQLSRKILELLNKPNNTISTIESIMKLIKQDVGFEAVGIRLREGEDFPYYVANGFSEDFLCKERYLCQRDDKGDIVRDKQSHPYLECMCGNIISGRTDIKLPFFTECGSFWTNSTTDLLASTTEKERQARTRNRCNSEGYESVALIPLRSEEKIVGLLQFNDHRRNIFTLGMIKFFEGISSSIGIALVRKKMEGEIKERLNELEVFYKSAMGREERIVELKKEVEDLKKKLAK